MENREKLELRIEQLRARMYHAIEGNSNYDKVIEISQELDTLLNELENLEKSR
ncbi:aspartyl-phosphate phosphatase Spo0E family protein [Oceanobacillus sp. FSL K6-2867]|uniref:aspartyl-phosphate phosphatase Spo0E family protein n=1 Tax=Oceanobacillus sp. FSL K6-2867 TaxID=2954748 RepID=UPI0030D9F13C